MCVAITGIREEGKNEGRVEGRVEGRIEGRVEGRVEGALKILFDLVKDGLLKIEDAAPRANLSEDAFKEQLRKYESQ